MNLFGPSLSNELLLVFLGLLETFIILILILRVVWRVEKQLDRFFKLLALAFGLIFIKYLATLFQALEIIDPAWLPFADAIALAVIIAALGVMNRIVERFSSDR